MDSRKEKIKEYLGVNRFMIYTYDLGDHWQHRLLVEQVVAPELGKTYPICIAGTKCCPPEDSGGISGHYGLVKMMKQGKGQEYNSYITWLGYQYDPDYFDLEATNKKLSRWRKVAKEWETSTFAY